MAVADVIISRVLDSLISFVAGEIEQQVKLVAGVEDEIKMLTTNLQSIQAVLIDAENKQLKQEAVQLWLGRLKLISYDIDDVLDEWSTEILKSKIEGDDTVKRRSKVWSFINSFCICFHEVGFRRDIAVKIRELNGSLDLIAKEKEKYSFQQIQGISERVHRVMTTSLVNIQEVKGREHNKNVVMHSLLVESKRNPHVISLVGMGGIGKTTLAKLVYNEDSLKSVFDIRIWVCVSDPFDEMRIAKAILESLKGTTPSLVEMQNVVRDIQKYIEGKRFLLVLDDVWNEDVQKWEQVEHFVKCGSPGSKILVTTRKENVAKKMGCSPGDVIKLGILSDEECWSIFSEVVFLEDNTGRHNKSFQEIGKKIVRKCKGLPLAVKTIGGLLRFKYSIEEWQAVLDNELWELEDVEKEVFAPLRLSYDDLSSSLKQCFLYCAVFPKDHRMGRKELIAMWASQGYIMKSHNDDVEVVGDEHFQHLAMRSFFQDFKFDEWNASITTFKMHDIVHDFAQSLIIKKEYCSTEVNDLEELNIDLNDNKIFHVGFVPRGGVPFHSSFCTLEKLRSLVVLSIGNSMIEGSLTDIFSQLTCLRTLSLRCCGLRNVPANISKLVHLRQLDLSQNQILKELPETICELCNLETLNVDGCSLKSLPGDMGKLVNLKCLYNLGCPLPKEIGKLSGLQRLGWIEVDSHEREAVCIEDIKNLKQLGGSLEICWKRQVRDVDVRNAEGVLKEKRNLSQLTLSFEIFEEAEREHQYKELIEALEAPSNLKYLKIGWYEGTNSPSWISSLPCLRKVYLSCWRNCTEMPPLGKLPSLECLEIYDFTSVKRVEAEFLGMNETKIATSSTATIAFPKLTELRIEYLSNWEVWKEVDGINEQKENNGQEESILTRQIMPCLHSFILYGCPKLKVLPSFIVRNTLLKCEIPKHIL